MLDKPDFMIPLLFLIYKNILSQLTKLMIDQYIHISRFIKKQNFYLFKKKGILLLTSSFVNNNFNLKNLKREKRNVVKH